MEFLDHSSAWLEHDLDITHLSLCDVLRQFAAIRYLCGFDGSAAELLSIVTTFEQGVHQCFDNVRATTQRNLPPSCPRRNLGQF